MCVPLKTATITKVTIDRYHRQVLLPPIGAEGQKRLGESKVLLIGCGALGSTITEQLTRAGVGYIRIADRDIVELTNLQRQVLFEEEDARQALPKAIAAANRLTRVNSSITIEPRIVDVDASNIEPLAEGVQVILDGTDNVATRYLVNDLAIKLGIPWIYGACVGTEGRVMAVLPQQGPCLRCIFPTSPDPRELGTCDTAGVLGPVASVVGAMQAIAAIKLLSGNLEAIRPELLSFDLWANRIHSTDLTDARRGDCRTCGERRFEFLQSVEGDMTAKLCGRNAVQVRASRNGSIALQTVAERLKRVGQVTATAFMVRCALPEAGQSITVFEDGRVIVQGTTDPAVARVLVAKYVGS